MSRRHDQPHDWYELSKDDQWADFGAADVQYFLAFDRMCERNLRWSDSEGFSSEFYRIVCLPAFDRPYCVRWQRTGDRFVAVYKETDGASGWDRGHLCRGLQIHLSLEQWQGIMKVVDAHDFWTTPRCLPCNGLDGESWLMEGLRGPDYRVISRWNGGTIGAILRGARDLVPELRDFRPNVAAG
jgi:hypothetical protein